MSRLRQIWLDCDGVLADMDEKILSLFGMSNAEEVLGKGTFWRMVAAHPGFYANLKVMPGAYKLVRGAKALCHEYGLPGPRILTGLPLGDWAEPQKQAWRLKNFPDLNMKACMAKDKCLHKNSAIDILIDDRLQYATKWEESGGIFIHHTDVDRSLYLLEAELEDTMARA